MKTAITIRRATRLARSNHRVTQGCVYPMNNDGTITDDLGNSMTPCTDKPGYWLVEEDTVALKLDSQMIMPSSQINDLRVGLRVAAETTWGCYPVNTPLRDLTKMSRSQQLTIRKVTLINDRDVSNYDTNDIIALIQQEEARRKTLTDLDPVIFEKSEAIKKLVAKHTQNIQDLLEVLDQLPTE